MIDVNSQELEIKLNFPDKSMYIEQILYLTNVLYLAADSIDNTPMMGTIQLLERMIRELQSLNELEQKKEFEDK